MAPHIYSVLQRCSEVQKVSVASLIYTSSVQIIVSLQFVFMLYLLSCALQGQGAQSPLATVAMAVKLLVVTEHSFRKWWISL